MQFMPGRFDPISPRFDGKPSHLAIFLDEVEALAVSCSQTANQTIRAAIRYSPDDVYELWSGIPEARGEDWQAYKAALHRFYPGSDGARRYSIRHLEQLVERQEFSPIEDQDEFGTYYRSFTIVSDYLLEKDRLSRRESSSYFLSGFHFDFRNKIRRQLQAENPRRYHDDFFTVEEIRDVAVFLLGGERHSTLTVDTEPIHNQHSPSVASTVPDTSHTLPPSILSHPSNLLHELQATAISTSPSPFPVTEAALMRSATNTTDSFAAATPLDSRMTQILQQNESAFDQALYKSLPLSSYQLSYKEQVAVANEIHKLLQMSATIPPSPAALATHFEHKNTHLSPAVIPAATSTLAVAPFNCLKPQSSTPSKELKRSISVEEDTLPTISFVKCALDDITVNSASPTCVFTDNSGTSDSENDNCALIDPETQDAMPISSTAENSMEYNEDSSLIDYTQSEQQENHHRTEPISQKYPDSIKPPENTMIDVKSAGMDTELEPRNKDELDEPSQHPAHTNSTVPFSETTPAETTTSLAVIINVLLACFWLSFASSIRISSSIVSIIAYHLPSVRSLASLDTIVSSITSAGHKTIFSKRTSLQRRPSTKEVTSINTEPISTNHPTGTLSSFYSYISTIHRLFRHHHSLLKHPIDVSREPDTDRLNSRLGSAQKRQQPRKEAKSTAHTKEPPIIASASRNTPELDHGSPSIRTTRCHSSSETASPTFITKQVATAAEKLKKKSSEAMFQFRLTSASSYHNHELNQPTASSDTRPAHTGGQNRRRQYPKFRRSRPQSSNHESKPYPLAFQRFFNHKLAHTVTPSITTAISYFALSIFAFRILPASMSPSSTLRTLVVVLVVPLITRYRVSVKELGATKPRNILPIPKIQLWLTWKSAFEVPGRCEVPSTGALVNEQSNRIYMNHQTHQNFPARRLHQTPPRSTLSQLLKPLIVWEVNLLVQGTS